MDLNFDYLFRTPINCLRINRSHPDIPKDKKWVAQFILTYGIYFMESSLIAYSTFVHDIKNDTSKAVANMSFLVIYAVITAKYMMLLCHQNLLIGLIDTVKKDYEVAKSLPWEERALVVEYAKKGVWVVDFWFRIVFLCSLLFPFTSFTLMFYYYIIGETKLVEMYDLTYPTAIEEIKFQIVPYILLFALLCYVDVYNVLMYTGVVPLAPMFMLHACGQLEVLKVRVNQLISEQEGIQERDYKLKVIVKQLQDIYRFVGEIQTGFGFLYELLLKGTSIMLPVVAYELLETFNRGGVGLEFITLFGATVVLSYLPCYYGDLLIEKAESFRTAVYMSGWEGVWDKRARTTILVIMTRTQRTVAIRTMFRSLCLDALTDVYQQGYAFFNFLIAAWK